MKKLFAGLLALVCSAALAQSYPSPIYNNLTVQGTATLTNHPLAVSSGGTNAATASGTALDNISGFSGTGFLTRTGAGAYAFQSLTNGITYANLAQAAANTLLGNATGSTANVVAISMPSCSTSSSALNWTSASGPTCNTSINAASLGGTAASSYALLASPAFTGTPTAPTATVGTNTTQLATTAFVIANAGTGRLIGVQIFTVSGTYTPDTGTNSVIVEDVGGGGGSGGMPATASGANGASVSGAAGSYASVRLTSGFSGVTVTPGAFGAAGAAGSNAGGTGGTTTFGSLISCPGGTGGPAGSSNTGVSTTSGASPPAACTVSSGTTIVSMPGQGGSPLVGFASNAGIVSGAGGSSPLGYGGRGSSFGGTCYAGSGYGAGAGGLPLAASASATAGCAASQGAVIVWEYN